jgi:hypothetical protein
MRRIFALVLVVLLIAAPAHATIALVANVAAGSVANSTITTTAINTTGADTIVCYISEQDNAIDTTISDTNANTWNQLTQQRNGATANLLGRMWYCQNCTVGASHTFTATDGGDTISRPSIACAAFSGGHLTALIDQQTGTADVDGGTTTDTGAISPSENNTLVVTGIAVGANAATYTIDGSYTITDQIAVTANHFGVALAYEIQTTATATNRRWTSSTNTYVMTTIASFKSAGGGGGGSSPSSRGLLLGVGP